MLVHEPASRPAVRGAASHHLGRDHEMLSVDRGSRASLEEPFKRSRQGSAHLRRGLAQHQGQMESRRSVPSKPRSQPREHPDRHA
eukprot:10707975-Prorocentrum_lima.AAC.1